MAESEWVEDQGGAQAGQGAVGGRAPRGSLPGAETSAAEMRRGRRRAGETPGHQRWGGVFGEQRVVNN